MPAKPNLIRRAASLSLPEARPTALQSLPPFKDIPSPRGLVYNLTLTSHLDIITRSQNKKVGSQSVQECFKKRVPGVIILSG